MAEIDPVNPYSDLEEEKIQDHLWIATEKKHPWFDPPPKVKVTTKNGLCHMKIEFTIGQTPNSVYEFLSNPNEAPLFIELLENKSRKVLKKDGPREILKSEKTLVEKFFGLSLSIPITLIVDENKKDYTSKYKKEKLMFMKVFEGSYKVEPLFVDSKRFSCKQIEPKTKEEYKRCSGGKGKIASKVTMDQYFQPYPIFDLPPVSWYIRWKTIETTKTLIKRLQKLGKMFRDV